MLQNSKTERTLYIGSFSITLIFLYYLTVFLAGIYMALVGIGFVPSQFDLFAKAVVGSVGMALNGSAIYYVRKLYKLCFSDSAIVTKGPEGTYLRKLGSIVYFVARPLFAVGFSILVVISLQTGVTVVSSQTPQLTDNYVFVSMFFSFFIGFLTGRFVNNLELVGESIVERTTKVNQ